MDTATSRCLFSTDIFNLIVTEIYREPTEWRSLAVLAATSRTFHDDVLPILWQRLDSLVPLLRLLPPGTWQETSVMGRGYFILMDSENLDWTRLAKYACHVRRFIWDNCEDVSLFTLIDISLIKPPSHPLLPCLQTLFINDMREHCYIPQLFFLLSASLIDLQIICRMDYKLDMLLDIVRRSCPRLEQLRIKPQVRSGAPFLPNEIHGATQVSLIRCIDVMRDLRVIRCQTIPLSAVTFRALGTLPRLRKVSAHLPRGALNDIANTLGRDMQTGLWFPALTNVFFSVDELGEDIAALAASFKHLEAVFMAPFRHPSTRDVRRFLETLAGSNGAYAGTLTGIQICFSWSNLAALIPDLDPDAGVPTVDIGEAFKPMLQRPQLCQLRLVTVMGYSVHISKADLFKFAESYPSLCSFMVWSRDRTCGTDQLLSKQDIQKLEHMCSDLTNLYLPWAPKDSEEPGTQVGMAARRDAC